jgi:hypothetical protein
MRPSLLAALALVVCALAAGCGGNEGDAGGGGETALTIVFRGDAQRPETEETWTLTCDPPVGTHPDPDAACARLDEVGPEAFEQRLDDRACAEIYGGPQEAVVTGTVDGEPVSATFHRRNGCEIEDWDRLLGLLPPGGA